MGGQVWGWGGHAAGDGGVLPMKPVCPHAALQPGWVVYVCLVFRVVGTQDGDTGVLRPKMFRSGMLRARILESGDGEAQSAEIWDFRDLGCRRPRILRLAMWETQNFGDQACQAHGMLETWGVET